MERDVTVRECVCVCVCGCGVWGVREMGGRKRKREGRDSWKEM